MHYFLWLWDVIIPFKIETTEKPHTLQVATESFKIQLYLRGLELPQADMEKNFLSLENRNFENVSFSQK